MLSVANEGSSDQVAPSGVVLFGGVTLRLIVSESPGCTADSFSVTTRFSPTTWVLAISPASELEAL